MTTLIWRRALGRLAWRTAFSGLTLIFFLPLSVWFGEKNSLAVAIFAGLAGLAYALYQTYSQTRRQGEHDRNLILHDRMTRQPLSGLYAALLAEIPSLALVVALFATVNTEHYWLPVLINMFYNIHYWWLLALVPSPLIMLLCLPALPLCAHLGYRKGLSAPADTKK